MPDKKQQQPPKKKPIVVTDKNDKRLKAYQDSLRLFNMGIKNDKDAQKRGERFLWKAEYDKEDDEGLNRTFNNNKGTGTYNKNLKDNNTNIRPLRFKERMTNSNTKGAVSGSIDYPIYEKPNQEVIYKPKSTGKQPVKAVGIQQRKKELSVLKLPNLQPDVNITPNVEPLVERVKARIPKYYKINDKIKGSLNGSENESDYQVDSLDELTKLAPWNKRTITPQYAMGGFMNENNGSRPTTMNTKDLLTKFKLPNYISGKSFAEASTMINKKFDGRNDVISNSTKEELLKRLASAQEHIKSLEQPVQSNQMFFGGPEETMMQGAAESGAGSALMPGVSGGMQALEGLISGDKKSTASGIGSAALGIAGTAIGGPIGGMIGSTVGSLAGSLFGGNKREEARKIREKNIIASSRYASDFAYGGPINGKFSGLPFDERMMAMDDLNEIDALKGPMVDNTIQNDLAITEGSIPGKVSFDSSAGKKFNWDKINSGLSKAGDMLGTAARYAPAIANAMQLKNLKKTAPVNYNKINTRFNPEYVDERSLQNIAGNEYDNSVNALTQMGGSTGATRAAILGAGLNKTKGLSDAYMNASAQNRATKMQGQQFNLGIDQFNTQIANRGIDETRADTGAYNTAKSALIGQLGNDIGNIGKEELFKKYPKMMGLGYDWDGKYFINPQTGERKTAQEAAEFEKVTSNMKLRGGFMSTDGLAHMSSLFSKKR